jgi:hypothetical protein
MCKRILWLTTLTLAAMLLAACAPMAGDPASTEAAAVKVTEAGDTPPAFTQKLRVELAQQLGIDVAQITLKEASEVMWPDSCLGVEVEGMMCLEVITPGYLIIFATPLGDYEYHTDKDGTNTRLLPPKQGQSGIEGQVLIGPNCPGPVSSEDTNCGDKPYQATIAVLDSSGQQVTQFQSDEEGRFKVNLPPGTYTLKPQADNPLPMAAEQTVEVQEGQFISVTIYYDTGIR